MDKKKKRDLILVVIILAIAAVTGAGSYFYKQKPAVYAEVSVDGKVVETLDLNEDRELTIEGYNGGTNHLVIKNKEAYVTEASCPDKVCIHQGKIHNSTEMIVCLPNRFSVRIVGN